MFKEKLLLGVFLVFFFLINWLGFTFPVFSASYKESAEPEVIIPKPGIASTDFEIEYKDQKTETKTSFWSIIGLSPPGGSSQESSDYQNRYLEGDLFWQEYNYPDFSIMNKVMTGASQKLLPKELGENLEIRGEESFSGETKHHVFGRFQQGDLIIEDPEPLETPTERVNTPPEWPQIIGQSKILGGLLGAFEAPSSVIIDIVNPTNTSAPPRKTGHTITDIKSEASQANNTTENKRFKTLTLLQEIVKSVVSFFEDLFTEADEEGNILEQFLAWFRKEETEETLIGQDESGEFTLVNKTRATVPGLETINEQANFFAAFLPADLVKDKDGRISAPLAVEAQYEVSEKYSLKEGSNETVFQNLGKTVKNYCLALCSQYPADYPINRIDPLCTSCNPSDYEMTGYGDVLLNRDICQFEGGACHYFLPYDDTNQGCGPGQDPICEGGRCNPYEISLDGDYDACGGPPHGSCVDSSVCYVMTFAPNPAGGFGECQYANPNVCVRADRIQVGECAAVCNWACCAWQEY